MIEFIKKMFWQIMIVILVGSFLFLTDFAYVKGVYGDVYPRHLSSWAEAIGIALILSLAFRRRGFFIFFFILSLMSWVQMAHMAYYGAFVHPTKIWLLFTQLGEVFETLGTLGPKLIIPTVVFLGSLGVIAALWKRYPQKPVVVPFLRYVLIAALIYSPIRTFVSGNTYGKQPAVHNLGYSNLYASMSYFIGRTLPYKMTHVREASNDMVNFDKREENPKATIVFIMGESLRYQNLSIFDYPRETTPFLNSLKLKGDLVSRKTISGGVSTDVAVPMIFNQTSGMNAINDMMAQKKCLFKLAKQNGFGTYFYSGQTKVSLSHIMNFLCPQFIDQVSLLDDETEDQGKSDLYDDVLIENMKNINWDQPNFIVLHQRGSHTPYAYRYPEAYAKFPIGKSDTDAEKQVNHYDNTIVYTDHIFRQITEYVLNRAKGPVYFVYTSDHGQSLGEHKHWGHGFLNSEEVISVPTMTWTRPGHEKDLDVLKTWPALITHRDVSNWLLYLMGYKAEFANFPLERAITVMGADLDGVDGAMTVKISQEKVESMTPVESK
jgi:Predicted membrane-associated, metal-dependent hydrolase